ncbi:MAG: sensor histidine kinase [Pseudobdellovibrionaceae bacterium]
MQKELHKARVKVLFNQTFFVHVAGFLNAALFAALHHDSFNTTHLIGWLTVVALIYVTRYSFNRWFKRIRSKKDFDPGKWENIFAAWVFLSGLTWSYVGLFFVNADNVAQCAFLGFLLAGITAAASTAYSASMKAVLAFLLPCVLPFAFHMLSVNDTLLRSMGGLICLFVGVIFGAIYKIRANILESFQLRFEKEEMLNELKNKQALLVNSAKMAALGEMAAGVAHEINTPLGVLQFGADAFVRGLKKEPLETEKLMSQAKNFEVTILKIAKIVKNLISFSGHNEEDFPKVNSAEQLVIETLDLCQSRFQNHAIELEIRPISSAYFVQCKSSQISQALLNLLINAFDAVKEKEIRKVIVEAEEQGPYIVFKVIDTGDGVPEEIQSHIMDPFFTTKEVGKGAGLGLSVALGIAHAHNGNLELIPSPAGACFALSIPKAVARAEVA